MLSWVNSTAASATAKVVAEQRRALRALSLLPRVLDIARQTSVGATPHEVVLQLGRFRLLRYRRETPATFAEPVLFCYALINRPYILDLLSGKSVVERYLAAGFEVYLIDWGVPSFHDRKMTIADHVCGFLRRAVELVRQRHATKAVHLLGYCMGGTFSALLAALVPEIVATLTLLAAPIDFAPRDSLLNVWIGDKQFDVDALVDAHGNCPGWFLQSCFLATRPVQNLIEKNLALLEQIEDRDAVATYVAMERWVNDNIPVPGETFREFVKLLYRRNELVRGTLVLQGQRVDLGRIQCPVLLLTAAADHLVVPASTEGIRPRLGSRDVTSLSIEAGHVGLVVGGKARNVMWPAATEWLRNRSSAVAAAAV